MKNSNIEWTDLPDYVRRYLDGIDVDAMGKDAADKLLASIDAVATQRATLEQQIYELTTSDAQKLIDTRAKEREAIDASNSTMLDRLYALQDERAATAAAAQAAQEKARIEEQIANQRSNLQTQLYQLTGNPRQRTSEKYWEEPLDWNADHEAFFAEHGRRQRVFCASLADVFDNEVPGLWRQHLMSLVAKTPNLDWLFLTKRIGNARKMLTEACMHDGLLLTADDQYRPPANLWIGATITSQAEADRDIPKLLATPAAKRFLSMEPLLGPVSLRWASAWPENAPYIAQSPIGHTNHLDGLRRLDWVIVGGESGPGARPMHPDWARSLRDQCQAAGVPFLFKQWGEWQPIGQMQEAEHRALYKSSVTAKSHEDQSNIDDIYGRVCTVQETVIHLDGSTHGITEPMSFLQGTGAMLAFKVGKKAAGRMLDGRTWDEVPA